MEIIQPRATIIEGMLQQLTIAQRIDHCASTCYQRPPKVSDEDAVSFCIKYGIEAGHLPMLEFAVIHLFMSISMAESLQNQKFLMVDPINEDRIIVTGSIRALLEAKGQAAEFIRESFLSHYYPYFFGQPTTPKTYLVRFADPWEIPDHHRHVAARFIISRAISHELVRHRPCGFLQESQRYCKYENVIFIQPLWAEPGPLYTEFADNCFDCEMNYQARRDMGLSPQQARGALNNDCKTDIVVFTHLGEWDHIFAQRCSLAADPEMRRVMLPLRDEMHSRYPDFPWSN